MPTTCWPIMVSCVLFVASHNLWHCPTGGGYRLVTGGGEAWNNCVWRCGNRHLFWCHFRVLYICTVLFLPTAETINCLQSESVGTPSLLWSCIITIVIHIGIIRVNLSKNHVHIWQFWSKQELAGSNEQALLSPCRWYSHSLMSLTACEEYKPLGVCLNFSMSAIPKTSQKNSGNRTAMAS